MKKLLFSLLCIFSFFIIVGYDKKVKDNSDTVMFTYNYGSYNSSYYQYTFIKKRQ